jgi:hypothetical protein
MFLEWRRQEAICVRIAYGRADVSLGGCPRAGTLEQGMR